MKESQILDPPPTLAAALQLELRVAQDNLYEVRCWLDQAQGQLQNTQTSLSQREADVRKARSSLKDARKARAEALVRGWGGVGGWEGGHGLTP